MFDVYNKEYENDLLRAENILYTKNNEDANDLLSQRREVPKRKGETSSYNDITTLADSRQVQLSARNYFDELYETMDDGRIKAKNVSDLSTEDWDKRIQKNNKDKTYIIRRERNLPRRKTE